MTEKLTTLEEVATEIIGGLDHISIWNNRDPDIKRIKREFIVGKILEWASRDGDCYG